MSDTSQPKLPKKAYGAHSNIGQSIGMDVHPVVFLVSAGIILLLVIVCLAALDSAKSFFSEVQSTIASSTGWFFILAVNVFLIFVVCLIFSPAAKLRLGQPDEKPEFGYLSWLAMLFSAGMGIGLLFFSVAEPIYHFTSPPHARVLPETQEAARRAMHLSYFHWGFHAWGIYALVGLSLAYFSFNKGLPLTIRSAFVPLLGDRVKGTLGDVIDILAVVATLFGVATSLGIGVQQVNAGLHHLFELPQEPATQVILIAAITAMATLSVVLGLDKGIRRLSECNLAMGLLLLIFVLVAGPTLFVLNGWVQNMGGYLQNFLALSTWTEAYQNTEWQNGWTVFYWAWWIAWSPFVGMFIARVSRGRTIREFLIGVLLVPTVLTFLWLSVFGNAALHNELLGEGTLVEAVRDNMPVALFQMLEPYPLGALASGLAILVIITFFVTSSDSGSLVIDIITAGGNTDPPVAQRIFWAVLEGVVAAVLLLGGGLGALQTASITTGLPFACVLLLMCISLYKALRSAQKANPGKPLSDSMPPAQNSFQDPAPSPPKEDAVVEAKQM
ncbi:MAG: BCCT family transporter [Opitutales bacterium]